MIEIIERTIIFKLNCEIGMHFMFRLITNLLPLKTYECILFDIQLSIQFNLKKMYKRAYNKDEIYITT